MNVIKLLVKKWRQHTAPKCIERGKTLKMLVTKLHQSGNICHKSSQLLSLMAFYLAASNQALENSQHTILVNSSIS